MGVLLMTYESAMSSLDVLADSVPIARQSCEACARDRATAAAAVHVTIEALPSKPAVPSNVEVIFGSSPAIVQSMRTTWHASRRLLSGWAT